MSGSQWIAVAMIRTGHVICTTQSTMKAAHALVPGTQYAKGWTDKSAQKAVGEACAQLRSEGY